MLQTDRSKFFTMMVIILLGLFSLTLLAQEKEEAKSKLNQLKGKVEKITVKVDGKDVVFEGEDAQKMADKMKSEKRIKVSSSRDFEHFEEGDGKVMMFRSKAKAGDFETKVGDIKKKIKVEDKDGKKVVTITTMKDGKEETKTYEGDEAEKFLNEEKGMKHITVTMNDDEDISRDRKMFFKHMEGNGCGCSCCCGEKMMRKHSPGKNMKHIIIEEKEDDEKSEKK